MIKELCENWLLICHQEHSMSEALAQLLFKKGSKCEVTLLTNPHQQNTRGQHCLLLQCHFRGPPWTSAFVHMPTALFTEQVLRSGLSGDPGLPISLVHLLACPRACDVTVVLTV